MRSQILEISGQSRRLALRRGAIIVSDDSTELGQIDLDGVLSIIITSHGASLSTPLIAEIASRNIPLIICNSHFQPISISLPITEHSDQTRRYEAQALAKTGVKNRIWQKIVKAKIKNQYELLRSYQLPGAERLNRLRGLVKSGDPQNVEAQSTQVYWPSLFGKTFRRDRHKGDPNVHRVRQNISRELSTLVIESLEQWMESMKYAAKPLLATVGDEPISTPAIAWLP